MSSAKNSKKNDLLISESVNEVLISDVVTTHSSSLQTGSAIWETLWDILVLSELRSLRTEE